jgi:hypothetical protein
MRHTALEGAPFEWRVIQPAANVLHRAANQARQRYDARAEEEAFTARQALATAMEMLPAAPSIC